MISSSPPRPAPARPLPSAWPSRRPCSATTSASGHARAPDGAGDRADPRTCAPGAARTRMALCRNRRQDRILRRRHGCAHRAAPSNAAPNRRRHSRPPARPYHPWRPRLSALRAVVLDEADEMLDLGFREDLEFILDAAPEDRRTLLFSATVPKPIAQLAKTSSAMPCALPPPVRRRAACRYRLQADRGPGAERRMPSSTRYCISTAPTPSSSPPPVRR